MDQPSILNMFRETGALLEGHFELRSGLHSDRYFQCALVLCHPDKAEALCSSLVEKLQEAGLLDGVNAVIAPALGGIIVGHELARAIGVQFVFAEKQEGKLAMRRFRINPGWRYLVAEDVVTRGGRANETAAIVEQGGSSVAGLAVIVDRSGGKAQFECPMVSLVKMEPAVYEPAACPLCADGLPLVHPGS